MPYDDLIHYDHTQPESHTPQIGLTVHHGAGDPFGVNSQTTEATINPAAQVTPNLKQNSLTPMSEDEIRMWHEDLSRRPTHETEPKIGSRENPFHGDEINVTTHATGITGTHDVDAGYSINKAESGTVSNEQMHENLTASAHPTHEQYKAMYGAGHDKKTEATRASMKSSNYNPVYNRSLTSEGGAEYPIGNTMMSHEDRMKTPGYQQAIEEQGTPGEIAEYQKHTGRHLAVSDDLQKAAENYTPEPKGQ